MLSTQTIPFQVTAPSPRKYELMVTTYDVKFIEQMGVLTVYSYTGGTTSVPVLWWSGASYSAHDTMNRSDSYSVSTSDTSTVRSFSLITKKMLLGGSKTPADYLIGFAKMFGLVFDVDSEGKKVTIRKRDHLFQAGVEDLTGRVDLSRDVEIVPIYASSKWYDFALDVANGSFAETYARNYGTVFGRQRVDTGYDFEADAVDLLSGIVYRSAVSKMDSGKYWNYILDGATFKPSPLVDKGCTITLFDTEKKSKSEELPCPPDTSVVTYYNATYNGCDADVRVELRTADGKPVDGQDILLWYTGSTTLPYFKVTDDNADMYLINGKACWILDPGLAAGISVPAFSRVKISSGAVTGSLDFGVPAEIPIPGVSFPTTSSLYAKAWKAYIADRFDADTKVLHCYVDFGGIQVGPELLRKFFFFDGAIWVLNKIVNYSLTTWDPVECEFIQVQDPAAYTSGQNF